MKAQESSRGSGGGCRHELSQRNGVTGTDRALRGLAPVPRSGTNLPRRGLGLSPSYNAAPTDGGTPMKRAWVLLAFLLVLPARAVTPTGQTDARNALAKDLLDLSGTRRQIEDLPAVIKASLQLLNGTGVKPSVVAALMRAAEESLDGKQLYKIVYDHVRHAGTADQLHDALVLARSPLALKFTQWEVDASKPEAVKEMREYISKLEPLDPERVRLMSTLDDLCGGTELAMDMELATFRASATAAQAALPPAKRHSQAQIDREAEKYADQARPGLKNQFIATAFYTYRRASNAVLLQYAELLMTPIGRWQSRTITAACKQAITSAMLKMGQQFVVRLDGLLASPSPSPSTKGH
jgi:hypothetical protein